MAEMDRPPDRPDPLHPVRPAAGRYDVSRSPSRSRVGLLEPPPSAFKFRPVGNQSPLAVCQRWPKLAGVGETLHACAPLGLAAGSAFKTRPVVSGPDGRT